MMLAGPETEVDSVLRVLLVEDHPMMRQGIRAVLEQEADMQLCGEADTADSALERIESDPPDLVIIDLSLKGRSGLDLIRNIRDRWPNLATLVLSMHSESAYAERALRSGARGYVTKSEPSERLIECIRAVRQGKICVGEGFADHMLCRIVEGQNGAGVLVNRLSDREFEVFELIGQGRSTRDIGKQLHISVKTVDAHREHIKQKLGLRNATELLTYAIRWNQLEQDGA